MRRLVLTFAILGLAGSMPALASAERDHQCRAGISAGLHWGGQPVSAPGQSYLGSLPVDMGPALAAPSLQARFYQYCMQGGRMAYWPYVHTFLRTNGFYMFGESADAAAVRMVREDGQRAARRLARADHRQTAPEGAPQVPDGAPAEARILWPDVQRTRSFYYGNRGDRMMLPDMVPGSLYFEMSGTNAFVTYGRDAMMYMQSIWYRLPARDF